MEQRQGPTKDADDGVLGDEALCLCAQPFIARAALWRSDTWAASKYAHGRGFHLPICFMLFVYTVPSPNALCRQSFRALPTLHLISRNEPTFSGRIVTASAAQWPTKLPAAAASFQRSMLASGDITPRDRQRHGPPGESYGVPSTTPRLGPPTHSPHPYLRPRRRLCPSSQLPVHHQSPKYESRWKACPRSKSVRHRLCPHAQSAAAAHHLR
jgi:hypothetical protein